jgi:small subunit ribosomal protein S10
MSNNSIRIKLQSFDPSLLESATKVIVNAVRSTGADVCGPVPLPRKIKRYTVIKSPHIDKKSREQFEIRSHARLVIIKYPTPQTMDALMKVDLSAGVHVEIKLEESVA